MELPHITHVRSLDGIIDRRQEHARRAARGLELRLARGAYVEIDGWSQLDARARYIVRVRAVAESRRNSGLVLSHWSAAAIHGLPILGQWPTRVHAIVGKTSGGRSDPALAKHSMALAADDVVFVEGLAVTSIARTVIDLAVAADYLTAIMVVDRALLIDRFDRVPPLVSREDLLVCWDRSMPFRGAQRALHVIEFGETKSESPLESVSRANMRVIRCPPPTLQKEFRDSAGRVGWSDFHWEAERLAGEADGDGKYLDARIRGTKSADQVTLEEKIREDRIRALGDGVTRWRWNVGVNPALLRAHLTRAGLTMGK